MEKQLNAMLKTGGLVLGGALLGYVLTTFVLNPTCPKPTNLRVVKKDFTSIDIAWDGLSDASFYTVVVRDSIQPESVLSLISVEGTSTSIKNLVPGKPYLIDVYTVCQVQIGQNKNASADISTLPTTINASTDFIIISEIPPTLQGCNFNTCNTNVNVTNNQFAWGTAPANFKIEIRKGSATGPVMVTNYVTKDNDPLGRPRIGYFRTGPCTSAPIVPTPAGLCSPVVPATLCGSFADGTATINYQLFFSQDHCTVQGLPTGYVLVVKQCGTASL
ncbi:MAG: fibronectin type III domain-containing protein [Saprospiraceae bacterium]|jgi:hypothetical protein